MSFFTSGTSGNFFSSISSKGIVRPNRFEVSISSAAGGDNRLVSLRCESCEIPGRNMRTEANENVYGPSYEIAHGLTLSGEIQMVFLLDSAYEIQQYFDEWQKKIYNENSYDMNYYTEYVGDMTIKQLDATDNVIFSCRVYEAYPKTVNAISLDQNSRNELTRLTVTMAYRDWKPDQYGSLNDAI